MKDEICRQSSAAPKGPNGDAPAAAVHGLLGRDGMAPGELLAARIAREIGARPIGQAGLLYVSKIAAH